MVMGLVSRLSLANHFDSETFLVVHPWFSQDGCQREGFWEVVRQVVSPLDLSRTLLVGWGLLVPCSLPGPFVVKQLMQMVTVVPGQGGRFHGFNQRASPNKNTWVNFRKLVLSVSKFFCDLLYMQNRLLIISSNWSQLLINIYYSINYINYK